MLTSALEKIDILFPSTTRTPTIPIDINLCHLGVTGKGEEARLHSVSVLNEYGEIVTGRPGPGDVRPLLYVHEHFDTVNSGVDLSVMCKQLYGDHRHLLDLDCIFNLQVLTILATYAQNTSYAQQFVFNVEAEGDISKTSCGWIDLNMIHLFNIRVGGQAVAHLLMNIPTSASFVDVWVDDVYHLQSLLTLLRYRFKGVVVGRSSGPLIVCRPGATCTCRIHVGDVDIMKIQPDFAQCVYDGHKFAATARCLLALAGSPDLGEPTVMQDDAIWHMLTQHRCIDVSTESNSDQRCFPHPPSTEGYIERLYVQAVVMNEVYVCRDDLEGFIQLRVKGKVTHAPSGAEMTHVPPGCSISGTVLHGTILNPQVHPGHRARIRWQRLCLI